MTAFAVANPWGRWSARLAAGFFVLFSIFQVALALGAPLGFMAWGGRSAVLPAPLRASSALAALVLAGAAVVMLVRAGDLGRTAPRPLFLGLNILFAGYLLLNTAGNLVSQSPMERAVMGSATMLGSALCILAAVLARPVKVGG